MRNVLKALTLCLIIMGINISLDAQNTSINYKKGYRPDVQLSWANNGMFSIMTAQSFNFGNGLAIGLGTGFNADFAGKDFKSEYADEPTYLIPVFADLKYSFIDGNVSPVVELKAGEMFDVTNSGLIFYLSPSAGINIGRFGVTVGYELYSNIAKLSDYCPENYLDKDVMHKVRLGVAFTF